VADHEHEIKKLYYTIGEVAEMFKVNTSLVRYWEKEFEILKPQKNKKNGNRMFSPKDVRTMHIIYHLVKERGLTLRGAKQKLKENREDTINNFDVVTKLQDIKKLLTDMSDLLD